MSLFRWVSHIFWWLNSQHHCILWFIFQKSWASLTCGKISFVYLLVISNMVHCSILHILLILIFTIEQDLIKHDRLILFSARELRPTCLIIHDSCGYFVLTAEHLSHILIDKVRIPVRNRIICAYVIISWLQLLLLLDSIASQYILSR